jgi:hypothetical protein
MESIVAAACLGGGLVTMVVTLVLTMRLQARTRNPDADDVTPANAHRPHLDDR